MVDEVAKLTGQAGSLAGTHWISYVSPAAEVPRYQFNVGGLEYTVGFPTGQDAIGTTGPPAVLDIIVNNAGIDQSDFVIPSVDLTLHAY